MPLAVKVYALMQSLSPADVERLPPFERRRLADLCRHVAALAEQDAKAEAPKSGVLDALRHSRGHE